MRAGQANVECAFDRMARFAISVLVRISARLWLGLCALFLAGPARSATAAPDSRALLSAALAADDLTRATLTQRLGDTAVLAALAQHEDVMSRLAAVRCAPYMREPERALPALAELAAGRDPELAPAAARRLRPIAQQLALRAQAAEDERGGEALLAVQRALLELAAAPGVLAEVRSCAGQAAFLLEQAAGVRTAP